MFSGGSNRMRRARIAVLVFFLRILFLSILPGWAGLSAQTAGNDRVIIRKYTAEDRIPAEIVDIAFDRQGRTWVLPSDDNIRYFDGANVHIVETPWNQSSPAFSFTTIRKDADNEVYFLTKDGKKIFRLAANGELIFDSTLSAFNIPPNTRTPYFDWARFIHGGTDAKTREYRQTLKARLFANDSFFPLNDSAFLFTEGGHAYLYRSDRLSVINNTHIGPANAVLLDNQLLLFEKNRFSYVDTASGKEQEIRLTGDILADSLYRGIATGTARQGGKTDPAIRLFLSDAPHLVFNNRLYRLYFRDRTSLETRLVCDLSFLHHPISKVTFEPHQGVTAIFNPIEGLFLIRPNPFYAGDLAGSFQELRKREVFYPLTIQNKTRFLTPWGTFSGRGNYTILDTTRPGSKCLLSAAAGDVWEGIGTRVIHYSPNMLKLSETELGPWNKHVVDLATDEQGD